MPLGLLLKWHACPCILMTLWTFPAANPPEESAVRQDLPGQVIQGWVNRESRQLTELADLTVDTFGDGVSVKFRN